MEKVCASSVVKVLEQLECRDNETASQWRTVESGEHAKLA